MTDKKVLITGATGGMGKSSALLAASRGYSLLLVDLNEEKLAAVAEKCAAKGVQVDTQVLDISDSDAVASFAAKCKAGEALDSAIHTAGLSPQMAEWDKVMQVDLAGTVRLAEALRPSIRAGGCTVVISSMSAHMVPPNPEVESALSDPLADDLLAKVDALPEKPLSHSGIAYAYAKKALLSYVSGQAAEWGKESKRLASISPGLIDTPMGQLEAEADKDAYAWMRSMIALQRDGNPDEIASAALFLISDDASYISGCDLLVDGGFVGTFKAQNNA